MNAPSNVTEITVVPVKAEGVVNRWGSFIIDTFIISIIAGIIIGVISVITQQTLSNFPDNLQANEGILIISIPIIWILYFFISEGIFGTTIGKSAGQLVVISKKGGRANWGQVAIRAFLNPIENTTLIGGIVALLTPLNQRIADLIAGTLVVNKQKVSKAIFDPPALLLDFHDGRQVSFEQIREAVLYKFALVRNLVLIGSSTDGQEIRLTIYGQYFRSQFNTLYHEIERKLGLHIQQKVMIGRLLLLIFAMVLLLLVCVVLLVSSQQ